MEQTAKPAEKAVPAEPRRGEGVGVLLINLGTPDATDYWSMRRYLSEFLSDRRVIDYSPWFWQPLLQLVILTRRPFTSGRAYREIWNRERDEGPLKTYTRNQAEKLQQRLAAIAPGITVDWAMRYGRPSIPDVLAAMTARGCRRILAMALYPQYAAASTATAYDRLFGALQGMKWQPAVRTLPPYFDHPGYIAALARRVTDHLARLDFEPQLLLTSYHGMPARSVEEGDPYYHQCLVTSEQLRRALGWPEERILVCFQSRFGSEEWLKPYLDETLEELPQRGIRRIAVISPAFAADCLETLEEIAISGRDRFVAAGGEAFTYIPCLNDGEDHIALLEELARRELAGWI